MKRSASTHSPAFERGPDRFRDMVGASRGEQQGFGLRPPAIVAAAEQQFTDLLGALAAPGFSGDKNVEAARPQRLGERLYLCRLADPLPALEADELPARASRHPEQRLEAEPDAAEEACLADVLAGDQRHDLRRRIAGGDDQLGDILALRDRRDQRAFVADLHLDVAAATARREP